MGQAACVWWGMESSASSSAYQGLSVVLRTLMVAVGAWGGRGLLRPVLTLLLWGRVSRIRVRMERLVARFEAGRLRSVWPRPVPAPTAAGLMGGAAAPDSTGCGVVADGLGVLGGGRARRPTGRVWPGRFGWLVRMASWQAAGYGSQLRTVLETPEMVALLIAAPQAVAILRPLCRALGISTSVLRPGVVAGVDLAEMDGASAPRSPVKRKRVRRVVDWGRIPLPRGTLARARRDGFGKLPRD